MDAMTLRAIAYLRTSKDEEHQDPASQRAEIERWAETEGVQIVGGWDHYDCGVSGGAPLQKRPRLWDAMADVGTHKAKYLVVADRERLGRDVYRVGAILHELERENRRAVIWAVDGGRIGNGDDPDADLLKMLKDMMNQHRLARDSAAIRRALRLKKDRGELIGATPPYGFESYPDENGALNRSGRPLLRLRPHPSEYPVRLKIREWRESGLSLQAICDHLEVSGIQPRGEKWHRATILRICSYSEVETTCIGAAEVNTP